MKNLTDSQLLEAIKLSNSSAFDILFDRYWDKLYNIALSRLNDSDQVQDIIQELFIKIWERKENINIKISFESYLLGALKFAIISYFRSLKVKEQQLEEALQRIDVLEDSIHNLSDYILLEQTIEEAVNTMPEMLKQVYLLRSENLSVKEIAGKLGIADQTVKNYISEVLRRLRVKLAKKYPEGYVTYIAILFATLNH